MSFSLSRLHLLYFLAHLTLFALLLHHKYMQPIIQYHAHCEDSQTQPIVQNIGLYSLENAIFCV